MAKSPAALLIDDTGNIVGVSLDGAVYRLETTGKIQNVAGNPIDPATESKLEAVRSLLSTIDADTSNLDVLLSTRATESTLASIKDTDGVKKITDALPSGSNEIGAVAQGTKASGTDAWPSVLYDSSGNAVGVVLDGAVYRLQTLGKLLNVAGTQVNPATEDTLADVYARQADKTQFTRLTDGTYDAAVVDIDGVKHVAAGKTNTIDAANSTIAQLGIGGVFAPGGTDVSQYSSVAVTVHSDKDSALDGMKFEFSQDGTNWDDKYSFNLKASTSTTRRFQFPVTSQFFRVNYTNGGTATTALRIQTILHRENILTSIHRVEGVVREDRSAQLMKSAIIAQREGAAIRDFYPVNADVSGNLKVTTIGSDIPSDPAAFVLKYAMNGGSSNMRVNGSVTPVDFEIGPTIPNEIWSIRELLLIFTADDFDFDGLSFGSILALTNGVSIKIVKAAVATEVFVIKQNEDFLRVPGRTPLVNNTGPKDVLGAALSFQGLVLNQVDGDVVRVTIRDNLTSIKLKYLTATLFAVKVV